MSFINPRQMHAGLQGYLLPADRTSISAPATNPRLPVGPAASLPPGIRPIPTSSQTNKKTNAQIVYARTAVNTTAFGGLNKTIAEGDVAFVERLTHPKRKLTQIEQGKIVRVYTMEQINAKFADTRVETNTGKEISDYFSVDGVVNNLDGLDTHNEFRDHAIANTAIQGPCRLGVSREEARRVQIGDVLYIGLRATQRDPLPNAPAGASPTYKLELFRFFSGDVTRGRPELMQKLDDTKIAWSVGRIIDSNQSHLMTTVNVGVDRVEELTDEMIKLMVTKKRLDEIDATKRLYRETIDRRPQGVRDVIVLEMTIEASVKEQLRRRWRKAERG
jgi:hypothetical protein